MKTKHDAFKPGRKEQRMEPVRDDSYHASRKAPDAARCPRCGAAYLHGRWTWEKPAAAATSTTCPACLRIEQNQPAGFVTLRGAFFDAHRKEILELVAAREARERGEHPMQRIIGVEPAADGVVVTTTDAHLARGLGVAVQSAFQGDLDLDFVPGENLVRAVWKR